MEGLKLSLSETTRSSGRSGLARSHEFLLRLKIRIRTYDHMKSQKQLAVLGNVFDLGVVLQLPSVLSQFVAVARIRHHQHFRFGSVSDGIFHCDLQLHATNRSILRHGEAKLFLRRIIGHVHGDVGCIRIGMTHLYPWTLVSASYQSVASLVQTTGIPLKPS